MGRLCPSGEKCVATYEVRGGRDDAERIAEDIRIEQTVEFPADLVTNDEIREEIFGEVIGLEKLDDGLWSVRIAYSAEIVSGESTQLLNVLFGNTGIKPGIRLTDVEIPPGLRTVCPGPRFGVEGMRRLLGVVHRPLIASALKPMGFGAYELANLAAQMVEGGVDLIKDDHGLTDQPFCRFHDRVRAVADAVAHAAQRRGRPCLYAPNVTAPARDILPRALFARREGAGALMIAPGLCGFDALRMLADSDDIALPILCHPAFLGSFTTSAESGMSHAMTYATLPRLFGADATIFPNHGGRFSFSPSHCDEIAAACRADRDGIAPSFPIPAGGMTIDRVQELVHFYGADTILLIGGDLRRGGDVEDGCRRFLDAVAQAHPERTE